MTYPCALCGLWCLAVGTGQLTLDAVFKERAQLNENIVGNVTN